MLRSLFLLPLLFSPFTLADNVDVSTTVIQPDPNTYCVSSVCLSVNGGSGDGSGYGDTTSAPNPTQSPTAPPTVIVQTPPTCDVCEAGVLVFYMQPTCCPDGSVCDIAGLLSSGPLQLPTDCDDGGNAAITFNACTCTFYCNSTLGHGGAPSQPPTLPPTYAPTTQAPTTVAPTTLAPTTLAPTTLAPTTAAPTTAAPTTPAPTTQAPTTPAPTTPAPTTPAPTTTAPTTQAPTTQAPTTAAPTTVAPTTLAPTTAAPTTAAPTTKAPTTKAPTTKAPTTKAPTTKPPTKSPTTVPTTPSPSPCSRCNATHEFFVVFPVCCTNQIISTCNNNQIANAAKHLPDNCDQNAITWDGCSCTFYCNTTSATVVVNPNHPGNALPVPQSEVQTFQVDIKFNITQPNNHTRCIAGTSICITINSAPSHHMVTFPIIASVMMGLLAML